MTTIPDDMVERVARAIADQMHAGGDFGMTGADAYRRRSAEFMSMARAAIEAMQPAILAERERERAERYGKALAALDRAAKSAILENDMPNRVIFKDGFVVEGRAADEWLKFLRRIIDVCEQAAAIRSQS